MISYEPIKYKEPEAFLELCYARKNLTTGVEEVTDSSGVKLLILNNKDPEYWTSFDDVNIVFDSYNAEKQPTGIYFFNAFTHAYEYPAEWQMSDTFIPDLPADAFSALIEEAKSVAFITLKQMPNEKAEQKSQRQQRWLSRKAWKARGGVKFPNYGRR